MYSFKTLVQALLVASIATSSLAIALPARDEIHAERALLLHPGLTEGLERIGPAGLKALASSDIKKTIADVQQALQNVINGVREFDLDARDSRLPDRSPDVADSIKALAVRGVRNGDGRRQLSVPDGIAGDVSGAGGPVSSPGGLSDDELWLLKHDAIELAEGFI